MSGGPAGLSIACALYLLFAVTCTGSVSGTPHLLRPSAGQRVSLQHAPSSAPPDTTPAAPAAAHRLARRLLQQLQLQLPLVGESGRGPYTVVDSSANPRQVFNSSSSEIGQKVTPVPPSSAAPWSVGFPRFSASPVMQSVGLMAAGFVGGGVALWAVNYLHRQVDWEQDWQGQLLASLPAPMRNSRWVAAVQARRRQRERRRRRLERVESLLREGEGEQGQTQREREPTETWRPQQQQDEEEERRLQLRLEEEGRDRTRDESAPPSRSLSRGDRGAAAEAGGGQAGLRGGGVQGEGGGPGAAGEQHGVEALQQAVRAAGRGGSGPVGGMSDGGEGGATQVRSSTEPHLGVDCADSRGRHAQHRGQPPGLQHGQPSDEGRPAGGMVAEGSEAGPGGRCGERGQGEAGALAGPSGLGSASRSWS